MFVCETATHVLVHTPAKLNLFLEVFRRRADGFHEIETLMGTASIFDTLEFIPRNEGGLRIGCRWAGGLASRSRHDNSSVARLGDLPQGEGNIVHRALALLAGRCADPKCAEVRLTKRIPSAAGLGGASSDAAAALVAANLAWKLDWPRQRLMELAAELGSDIPFFLGSGWAVCRGRGERIEPIGGSRLHVVVVRPPAGLATSDVYRHCRPSAAAVSAGKLQAGLAAGNWRMMRGELMNRLEEPAEGLAPGIGKVKSELARLGVVDLQMSGSGSSCFGICRSARHARRIAAQLRSLSLGTVYQGVTAGRGRAAGNREQSRRC